MIQLPFLQDANEAAEALLSCFRQDLSFTAELCERYGIHSFPGHCDPVFRVLMDEWRDGRKYDWVTVARRLRAAGAANGSSADSIRPLLYEPHPLHRAESYARTLSQAQAALRLHKLGNELVQRSAEANADVAELRAHTERALASIESPQKSSDLPEWVDGFDLVINKPTPPQELIAGILHRGAKLVLGGSSKSNKTWSLLDMAVSVATGHDWWGNQTARGRVLYLNLEIASAFFAKRLHAVLEAKDVAIDKGDLTVWNLRGHSCDIGRLSDQILPAIKRSGFSLIVLDPIYKCLGNRDENKAGEIASLLNQIEHIAVECDAAIAFGAHYSKGNQSAKESIDRIGGSGVFARDPDAILTLTRHEEDEAFVCEPVLRNHAPCAPFVMRWQFPLMRRDDQLDPTALKQAKMGRKPTHSEESIVEVLRDMKEATTSEWQKKCEDELGMARRTFYAYKDKAYRAGMLLKSKMTDNWMPK